MKKYIFILIVFLLANKGFAQHQQHLAQIKITDDLYYTKIHDSVYMITHYFPYWGGNNILVLLPKKKAVLIDTPYENTGTIDLLNWLKKEFGDLEIIALITGFHQDMTTSIDR